MITRLLCLLFLPFAAYCQAADRHDPTLILMGGSYRTCSSLLHDDCRAGQREFPGARGKPVYRLDAARFPEILAPGYWQTRTGAPGLDALSALLHNTLRQSGPGPFNVDALITGFETADRATWNALLTQEQDLILSAFEQPQTINGQRRLEQVRIDGGNRPYDAALFRQLVAEAAKRSPGRKPRVAFTTSASANGFDAVDFYRALLEQAGAEPVWWPIDAAMARTRFAGTGTCADLHRLQRESFSMLGRQRVFPDLAAEQQAACENAASLDAIPGNVQALFLDGGDQWLHWNTFFMPDGRPNPWLVAVRAAFARGDLVVAGTSAGAAVQSGQPGMISNGTSASALSRGAKPAAFSMPEGCERAKRCPAGFIEDDLTWLRAGGLDLLGPVLVDTHVSERRRELRLLTLLAALTQQSTVAPTAGIGLDETSALLVRVQADGLQLEAVGQSGVWWFDPPDQRGRDGGWTTMGSYLAPGAVLTWRHGRLLPPAEAQPLNRQKPGILDGGNALQPEALRNAVWQLVRDKRSAAELDAAGYRLMVRATSASRYWVGPQGQQGVTGLEFMLDRP